MSLLLSNNGKAEKIDGNSPNSTGVITGKVKENSSNAPLEYANVAIYNSSDSTLVMGAVASVDGSFKMEGIPNGDYYLAIYFIGYNKKKIEGVQITKEAKKVDLGEIALEAAVSNLNEVNVSTEKSAVELRIDKKVINVDANIAATGGTAVDALKGVPSVTVDMEGNVLLRGSSAFKVLIDGKPQIISANDLLKQIPASAIEKIEVITNPSAKYDPEGASGIINIISKKSMAAGPSGMINASTGSNGRYNSDFVFNVNKNKWKFTFNGSYNKNVGKATSDLEQINFLNTGNQRLFSRVDRLNVVDPYDAGITVEYALNKSNTLSLTGQYGYWGMMREYNSTHFSYFNDVNIMNSVTYNKMEMGGFYHNVNAYWQHKFSKPNHTFTISITENPMKLDQLETVKDELADVNGESVLTRIGGREMTDHNKSLYYQGKIDYTLPFGKTNLLEAGIQADVKPMEEVQVFNDLDTLTGTWIKNDVFSNNLNYHRNIYAAYTEISGKTKFFDWKVGARGEYMDQLIDMRNDMGAFKQKRYDIFPSGFLMKELPKNQSVQVSYSKRVTRPEEWTITPTPMYSDKYVYMMGNPFLKPEFIHSYEANYSKQIKKTTISAGLFYRHTVDGIIQSYTPKDNGRVEISYVNLSKSDASGIELMGNSEINKWFSLISTGSYYYAENSGLVKGRNVLQKGSAWNIRLNPIFKVKTFTLQLDMSYTGPSFDGQGKLDKMFETGIALKKSFFKRKLFATVNVRDVFQTSNYHRYIKNELYTSDFNYYRQTPIVTFSLSYRLNNFRPTQQRNVESAAPVGGF